MTMDRRTLFTRRAFLGGGIGVAATLLVGCGGEESPPTATVAPVGSDGAVTVTPSAVRSGGSAGTVAPGRATGTSGAVASTIPVGIITSLTGAFPRPAQQFVEGFEYGLDYVTGGTGLVGGRQIAHVVEDDRGDSQVAVRVARALLDQGYRILTGSSDGACALAVGQLAAERGALFLCGPATADTVTGLNRHWGCLCLTDTPSLGLCEEVFDAPYPSALPAGVPGGGRPLGPQQREVDPGAGGRPRDFI